MKIFVVLFALLLSIILLAAIACQSNGGQPNTPIPVKDLLPAVGEEEAADDIILIPGGGPAYRANVHQQGVEDLWPSIETTNVVLGSGSNEAHITYRDYIETKAGETRKNIIEVILPNKDMSNLSLNAVVLPTGISLTEGMQWSGPSGIASVLAVEISQDIELGQYTFEIGLEVNGKDYGTIPCTIKILETIILPPEGVIEKEIQINESQTVNGITITLEQVVLTKLEAMFWAFNVPLDYRLPQDPNSPPPHLMLHAEAEYRLDGGPVKKAGPSRIRFYNEGMRHSWKHLDPVPKGTKELTFRITKLGDWEGPWEFNVLLGLTIDEIPIYSDTEELISTSVGQEFAIALYSNPRLGFNWYADYDKKMLVLVESPFVAKDILRPVDGTRYFHFKTLKAGRTEVSFDYQHGATGPASEQKVFNVEIK